MHRYALSLALLVLVAHTASAQMKLEWLDEYQDCELPVHASYHPNQAGRALVACGTDNTITLFNVEEFTFVPLQKYPVELVGQLTGVQYSPADGSRAVATAGGSIALLSVDEQAGIEIISSVTLDTVALHKVGVSPTGERGLVAAWHSVVHFKIENEQIEVVQILPIIDGFYCQSVVYVSESTALVSCENGIYTLDIADDIVTQKNTLFNVTGSRDIEMLALASGTIGLYVDQINNLYSFQYSYVDTTFQPLQLLLSIERANSVVVDHKDQTMLITGQQAVQMIGLSCLSEDCIPPPAINNAMSQSTRDLIITLACLIGLFVLIGIGLAIFIQKQQKKIGNLRRQLPGGGKTKNSHHDINNEHDDEMQNEKAYQH